MPASHEPLPEPHRPLRPNLDGADPLFRVVVREITVEPRRIMVLQGNVPQAAHLLISGLACRHRILTNGRRQITALLVPGDLCDLDAVLLGRAHCFVESLAPCVLGEIPGGALDDSDGQDPELRKALRRQLLRSDMISREWTVGMGRRDARGRFAHLLCELRERLMPVDLADGDTYPLPLTQADLGDTLGLSTVHVNRIIQRLREAGLIEFKNKTLHVIDHAALVRLADFDPAYLRLT